MFSTFDRQTLPEVNAVLSGQATTAAGQAVSIQRLESLQNDIVDSHKASKKNILHQDEKLMMNHSKPIQNDFTVEDDDCSGRLKRTNSITILFYIRITDNESDEVVRILKNCLHYVMANQKKLGKQIVGAIYLEKWIYRLIQKDIESIVTLYCDGNQNFFKIWPVIGDITALPNDTNKLLQQEIDVVYAFGGDGTLLSLLRALYKYYSKDEIPPIAAFNMGSLGYLCNFQASEYEAVINSTLFKNQGATSSNLFNTDNIDIQEQMTSRMATRENREAVHHKQIDFDYRMRLIARLKSDEILEKDYPFGNEFIENGQKHAMQALNEISITRGLAGGMCSFEIYVNNILLTVMQGDGVLISTPAGSTAYNLSCGGSIVHNAAQVICLTPICPHSLSFRPIILPSQTELVIRLTPSARQQAAQVTIDGQYNFKMKKGEYLNINESANQVPFIHWKRDNADQRWANKLNNQLHWNASVLQTGQKPLKGKL